MSIYAEREDGSLSIGDMSIPAITANRHYRQALEEVKEGDSEITPYVKSLSEIRSDSIANIKAEGLKRIQSKVDAIDSISMAKLIYKHMWPQPNPSNALLAGEAIYDYAAGKIDQARDATQEQLESYDPATDQNWPA